MFLRIIQPKKRNQTTHQGIEPSICATKKDFWFRIVEKWCVFWTAGLRLLAWIKKKKKKPAINTAHHQSKPKPNDAKKELNLTFAPNKERFLFSNCGKMMHLRAAGLCFLVRIEKKQASSFVRVIQPKLKIKKDASRNRTSNLRQKKRDFLFSNCGNMMHHLQSWFAFSRKNNKEKSNQPTTHHQSKKDAQRTRTSTFATKKRDFCFCC